MTLRWAVPYLSEILPSALPFSAINQVMKKKAISEVINQSYRKAGLKDTVIFADKLMYTGFKMAAKSGISIGVDDMVVPDSKVAILLKQKTRYLVFSNSSQTAW